MGALRLHLSASLILVLMVAAYPIEGCNSRPSYDDLPGLDGERLRLAATGSEIRRDLPSPPKAAQIAGKANARPRPNATSYDRDRDQFASSARLALIPLEENKMFGFRESLVKRRR